MGKRCADDGQIVLEDLHCRRTSPERAESKEQAIDHVRINPISYGQLRCNVQRANMADQESSEATAKDRRGIAGFGQLRREPRQASSLCANRVKSSLE